MQTRIELRDGSDCSLSYVQSTLGLAGLGDPRTCLDDNTKVERDALNYETAPMQADYYINGPIQADIWIETSATEAVLSVRVDDVHPDGFVEPLTNGSLLASLRAVDLERSRYMAGEMIQPWHPLSPQTEKDVRPGEVFNMQVEVFPTSALIQAGHKLRVSISASNQAQGILNREQRVQTNGGVITVQNSPEHPSSIVVPVVATSELN